MIIANCHIIYLFYPSIFIFTECDPGEYGVNCRDDCSRYCADPENCDNQDGTCSPCREWRIGNKCDVALGKKYSLTCLVWITTCIIKVQ